MTAKSRYFLLQGSEEDIQKYLKDNQIHLLLRNDVNKRIKCSTIFSKKGSPFAQYVSENQTFFLTYKNEVSNITIENNLFDTNVSAAICGCDGELSPHRAERDQLVIESTTPDTKPMVERKASGKRCKIDKHALETEANELELIHKTFLAQSGKEGESMNVLSVFSNLVSTLQENRNELLKLNKVQEENKQVMNEQLMKLNKVQEENKEIINELRIENQRLRDVNSNIFAELESISNSNKTAQEMSLEMQKIQVDTRQLLQWFIYRNINMNWLLLLEKSMFEKNLGMMSHFANVRMSDGLAASMRILHQHKEADRACKQLQLSNVIGRGHVKDIDSSMSEEEFTLHLELTVDYAITRQCRKYLMYNLRNREKIVTDPYAIYNAQGVQIASFKALPLIRDTDFMKKMTKVVDKSMNEIDKPYKEWFFRPILILDKENAQKNHYIAYFHSIWNQNGVSVLKRYVFDSLGERGQDIFYEFLKDTEKELTRNHKGSLKKKFLKIQTLNFEWHSSWNQMLNGAKTACGDAVIHHVHEVLSLDPELWEMLGIDGKNIRYQLQVDKNSGPIRYLLTLKLFDNFENTLKLSETIAFCENNIDELVMIDKI